MGNLLDQLDTSIQLRRIAMEAEQVCHTVQQYSHQCSTHYASSFRQYVTNQQYGKIHDFVFVKLTILLLEVLGNT